MTEQNKPSRWTPPQKTQGAHPAPHASTHAKKPAPHHGNKHPDRGNSGANAHKKNGPKARTYQYSGKGAPRGRSPQQSRGPKKNVTIPPVAPGVIRIIPLGGVEEIGKNMIAIETTEDLIVVDAGMQFAGDDTPGIDYIIPNTRYLEERQDKIRAMIITHGHLDHIGGVPLVLSRIGNPPVYSRNLSILLMKKRQSEFPQLPTLNAQVVEKDQTITLGNMKIKFWGVTHTIPDSMGIIIETPYGQIITPGDYKLDHVDGIPTASEEKEYKQFDNANVLLLMTDSTNIENEGFSLPEFKVHIGLENMIRDNKGGRIIIAAFASHITRLIKIIQIAEAFNKKIVVEGRSMKNNVDIMIQAGLIIPKKGTIIPVEEMEGYPHDKIIVLMTGAQGEEFAALNRAAMGTHAKFKLRKGDTIILSASIVPGNEIAVAKMKDGLARQGVNIVTYRTSGEDYVHATGHGNKEDIKWLHKKTHPKFFIPIHGHHHMLQSHKRLALELGMAEENIIVPDNGTIIEIIENGTKIVARQEKAPSAPMIVDGFSVGDVQDVVIRDRQMLAQDGMFVVIAAIDTNTGKLRKSPDLISRGFVYLKDNQELLRQARIIIKKTIEDNTASMNPINFDVIKTIIGDQVSKFLYQKTAKRPLVIPVILSM